MKRQDRRLLPKQTIMVEGELCVLIPLTKGKFAIVDDDLFDELNKWQWRFDGRFYAVKHVKGGSSISMHRIIAGTPDGLDTDHANRNSLDNRRINLRHATRSENRRNSAAYRNNRLGLKGIAVEGKRFKAVIQHDGNSVFLGVFDTVEQAVAARALAAVKFHGECARA